MLFSDRSVSLSCEYRHCHGLRVARGRTQPQLGGSYIHGVPIAPDNVRVVVDAALMEMELPYPTEELRTTIHAIRSYIQWL